MELFIILFLVVGILGLILFNSDKVTIDFGIESQFGEVVYVHNCYFTTYTEFGKRTDPIIYRIYYDKVKDEYTFRGYGDGWQEHDNYAHVFKLYRGVVEGLCEIKGGSIIIK